MGLFDKLKEPVFLKESSSAKEQLEKLKSFLETAPTEVKDKVEQDIKMLNSGIFGEDNVIYELKNSHMPMYVLHDLFIEEEGLTAQIDFLIITRKCNFLIECKNLLGNIEINSNGDFIRTTQFKGRNKKEGIYSPVTQNKRHLELLKSIRAKSKGNFLSKSLFEKNFYNVYRSVVVLANPKTILNNKYAKKEIKQQVIKADQLIEYIRRVNEESGIEASSDKQMLEVAKFYLDIHCENKTDYLAKYTITVPNEKEEIIEQVHTVEEFVETAQPDNIPVCIDDIRKALKEYRMNQSRKEKIKPYFIFNDKQMEDLISTHPKTIDDLMKVSGFGEAKCKKYGTDILEIIVKIESELSDKES